MNIAALTDYSLFGNIIYIFTFKILQKLKTQKKKTHKKTITGRPVLKFLI